MYKTNGEFVSFCTSWLYMNNLRPDVKQVFENDNERKILTKMLQISHM